MNAGLLKEPPLRSRKVLDHARGQRCTLRFRVCNSDSATTVSAHIRDRHKGTGRKSSDCSICFACSECHRYLDENLWLRDISEADMLRTVLRAVLETTEILIRDKVYGFPHDPETPVADKKTPPRKPKELRVKIPSRPMVANKSSFPPGRKLQGRNDLRRKT